MTQNKPFNPYTIKVDGRGRVWAKRSVRDYIGRPNGGPVELGLNERGELVLRAADPQNKNDEK